MECVYHIVTIRVNETSWAHVWRLRSRYLGMGYDINGINSMCFSYQKLKYAQLRLTLT
jgi:hypothetical protein